MAKVDSTKTLTLAEQGERRAGLDVAHVGMKPAEELDPANASSEEVEQTPEIKLETAPADFRFPATNQIRHCFTRYIEHHR